MSVNVLPIGHVTSTRRAAIDDNWDQELVSIALDPEQFGPEALAGLIDFSHVEVLFLFDQVPLNKIEMGARHPRGREDWPLVGIFAQRGKNRPNRIGLTTCRLVDVDGLTISLIGLDAIDGTPVLDVKPVMREFLPRGELRQPFWVDEIMKEYWNSEG